VSVERGQIKTQRVRAMQESARCGVAATLLHVGARHRLALFRQAMLLHQGDAMRRPYGRRRVLVRIGNSAPRFARERLSRRAQHV
jgi:hypothetical protein